MRAHEGWEVEVLDTTFGPYRIEELLGRGGMGEVYRAHDTDTDRTVALKVLPPHLAEDTEYQERFRRECRAAARLREPHIVPIHRFGEIDGRLYLDMRLVEGTDLATWLRTHGPMPPVAAVSVVSQVAAALDAAHAEGLVHRDVKPSNVLLAGVHGAQVTDREVFAYLFDFGIARAQQGVGEDPALTRAGTMPGSLAYVAPERFAGVEGDPRADVYALACVLHQALTGRPPFEGDLATLMSSHLNAPPPRPSSTRRDLPAGLDQVVAQGMAKDPAQRTASAGALAAAARAEIGGWGTDPHTSGSTVAFGAAARPNLDKPATAVIPPSWGAAPSNPSHPQNPWGAAPTGYGAAQPGYGPPTGYGPPPAYGPGWGATSHPSHPSYPAYPQPPRKDRTALIAIAVVATLALAGGGIAWAVTSGGGGGKTAITFTQSGEIDRFLAELPAGYGPANCVPESLQDPAAIAFVVCDGPPTTGAGPTSATFSRYSSTAAMNEQFFYNIDTEGVPATPGVISDCAVPGANVRAPYTRGDRAGGGTVACFTDAETGVAYLTWTDEVSPGLGYVQHAGGDSVALYDWWYNTDFLAGGG